MQTRVYTTPSRRITVTVFSVCMLFGIGALLFESGVSGSTFQSGGLTVLGGIQKGVATVGRTIGQAVTSIHQLGRLREQYELLAGRLNSLEKNIVDIEELNIQNEMLRNALNFSSAMQYSNTPALIIAHDPGNLFGTQIINKGSVHGVSNNDPVVAIQDGQQGLVGRIVETGRYTSVVQPIFDSRSHVAVRLQASRHEGLASGTGNPQRPLELQFIPQRAKEDIHSGDILNTSGLSQVFPRGILVGRVASFQAMPYESSLTIEIEPAVDFSRLEIVYVLIEENGGMQQ